MRTIQMTLDDALLKKVDWLAKQLKTTRSALTRDALRQVLARHETARLEAEHREGYAKQPVAPAEFSVWETEHAWGDE